MNGLDLLFFLLGNFSGVVENLFCFCCFWWIKESSGLEKM